jgi:N-dimethylarginine dimethylaminohydrolase
MTPKKNYQCLMIKTKDNRQFFTHEKYFPQLIEFSKTFGAEISVVKVEKAEILSCPQLAKALCDATYQQKPNYDLIEVKIAEFKNISPQAPAPKREKMREIAAQVQSHLKKEFLSGKLISLHKVKNKFKRHNLDISTVCNHITKVRKQLKKEGYEIVKMGAGKYQLS